MRLVISIFLTFATVETAVGQNVSLGVSPSQIETMAGSIVPIEFTIINDGAVRALMELRVRVAFPVDSPIAWARRHAIWNK
jgi:hypothetical protein